MSGWSAFVRAAWLCAAVSVVACVGCGPRSGGPGGGGNVLRYALQTAPTRLDPAEVQDGDTIDMLFQVFEGLVQWNEKNEIVPNLAESWTLSDDGRTYTFRIRDNVYFHAPFRRKLTAQDFVYSLTRALKAPVALTYLNDIVGAADVASGKAGALAGVKALDNRTLQITIDKRKPYFLGKLTYPCAYAVCREAIEKNGGVFDEKTMIGTGPFVMKEYRSGYSVTLAANPDYHGGRPILDGIERPILTDTNARQTKYESGGADITDVQRSDLDRIKADPQLSAQLKEFPRAAIWYLGMNPKAYKPFQDRRVRRAFAMAVNKDELIRLALKGTATKAEGIVPPGLPGHDDRFAGLAYDPAAAAKLLAEAGYPGGRGMPKLTIYYRQGMKQVEDGVMAIRDDLKRNLGVEADVQQVEWSQFLKQLNSKTVPCAHVRWAADYLDPQNFLSVLLRTGSWENNFNYSNPEFDKLCDQADVEPNSAKRMELYRRAERIAVDDAPWICLYFQRDLELHKPYVKGIRDSLMGHLPHTTTTVAGRR